MVLAVGARFNDRHTGDIKVYTGNRKFIHIDVDPGQIGKNLMPELGICADAKEALVAILEEVRSRGPARQPARGPRKFRICVQQWLEKWIMMTCQSKLKEFSKNSMSFSTRRPFS